MVTEEQLGEHIDDFVDLLRETQEYKDYMHMLEVIQRKPDLYDKTMEFRRDNYFLQHAPDYEDIYDRVAELRARNEELLDTPEVYDFLMTEWTYFHMMQSLFDRLMTEINF
ncbi:MAG: YlbF family regulator [Lachnospiraceae bacterium]|nr:YlbF family regulator [Lachnospiraceae bacterium]